MPQMDSLPEQTEAIFGWSNKIGPHIQNHVACLSLERQKLAACKYEVPEVGQVVFIANKTDALCIGLHHVGEAHDLTDDTAKVDTGILRPCKHLFDRLMMMASQSN